MLSSRLIRLVSDHWEQIAARALRQIRRDAKLHEMGSLPEADLRERAREILQNLGTWLVSNEDEMSKRYEALGITRCREGVPLHEIGRALQIIKNCMIQYVRDQGFGISPIQIYAEEELQLGADRIFDSMIYYVVRGYERAMQQRVMAA